MAEPNEDFEVIGEKGKYRWVWNNPRSAEQRLGPDVHKTKKAAHAAGVEWLSNRGRR